jgi:hypothetical protein
MSALGHTPSAAALTALLTVCCRTGQRRQALTVFRALAAAGAPLDAALVRALVLTLGKSAGATAWHDVPSEVRRRAHSTRDARARDSTRDARAHNSTRAARAHNSTRRTTTQQHAPHDHAHAHALGRSWPHPRAPAAPPRAAHARRDRSRAPDASCGPSQDVQRLVELCAEGDVEVDKELSSALVRLCASCGMLLAARQRLAAMVAARDPPMPPGSALLAHYVSACAKHAHGPEEGCRALAELGKEGPLALSKHTDIWMALLPACLAQRRPGIGLVLYKLLRSRGIDLDERNSLDLLAALEAGPHAESAFELRTLLELRGLATANDAHDANGAGDDDDDDDRPHGGSAHEPSTRPTAPPRAPSATPATSAAASAGGGAASAAAAAPAPARARPPVARTPSLEASAQARTLLKMLDTAIKEGRLSLAVDTTRRYCELGAPPPEERVLPLLSALFADEQTDAALSLYAMLQAPSHAPRGGAADESADDGAGAGGGASRGMMLAVLEGVVGDKRGVAKYATRAIDIFSELRAASADGGGVEESGEESGVPNELLRKLLKACLKADLVRTLTVGRSAGCCCSLLAACGSAPAAHVALHRPRTWLYASDGGTQRQPSCGWAPRQLPFV